MLLHSRSEKMEASFWKITLWFFVLASIFSVTSLLVGYYWLNTIVILAFSIILATLITLKFGFGEKVGKKALILCALLAFLLAFPLLFQHPFFDASSDAATIINLRILGEKIPLDYEPYSGISFSYQSAFSIFVKSFASIFYFIPDYLVYWILGLIVGGLELIVFYVFSKRFFKSEAVAEYSVILLFGTKMLFLNAYFGDHALNLGVSLLLLAVLAVHEDSKLKFLFFPALLVIHPGAAMLFFIVLISYALAFRQKARQALEILPFAILAVPAFIATYLPLASQVFSPSGNAGFASLNDLARQAILLPQALGLPVFALLLLFLFASRKKIPKSREFCFLKYAAVLSLIAYFALSIKQAPFTGKFFELITVVGIIATAVFIAENKTSKKFGIKLQVLVLAFCLLGFFASAQLNDLRKGTKMNSEEYWFALEFKKFDPELKETLFLTSRNSKIAEYSNKIPFDVLGEYFIAANQKQVRNDKAWAEAVSRRELRKKIIAEKCVECVEGINVDYAVVERGVFPELSWPKVLDYGKFAVFEKT